MNSKDAAVEVALLEIAKDLLQASDDMAATDPSASAKLAHEAYEIGRDLGIVRNHLDPSPVLAAEKVAANGAIFESTSSRSVPAASYLPAPAHSNGHKNGSSSTRVQEEEGDDKLFQILDRQREVVPSLPELAPARKPSRNAKQMKFEVATPRRSGWFSWMRSRDLHHAG